MDGIQYNVPKHLGQVRLLFDEKALESSLEEVSHAAVLMVEPTRVRTVEPLHPARQIRLGRLKNEMKMIAHQHPRGDTPMESTHSSSEEAEKCFAIAIGAEDVPAFVAARGNVVDGAGELETKLSCHKDTEVPSDRSPHRGLLPVWINQRQKLLGLEHQVRPPLLGV